MIKAKINCDAIEAIKTLHLLAHHFEESAELRACFNERFPTINDIFDVIHAKREGASALNVRIVPSEAIKSFTQDL